MKRPALDSYFEVTNKPNYWKLSCHTCGKQWAIEKRKLEANKVNLLAMIEHGLSHRRKG